MKLQLAMLGETEETEGLRADVAEMEQMIEAYLAFARGEGGEAPVLVDFSQTIRDVIAGIASESPIVAHIDDGIEIQVRPVAMRRCLTNLIGNALRFARSVSVTVVWQDRAAIVIIDDDGPGIPEADRETVFRPFVRLDPSRNTATGGVGLGLTIARDIAHGHGGDIALSKSPQGGLRVTLTLPG